MTGEDPFNETGSVWKLKMLNTILIDLLSFILYFLLNIAVLWLMLAALGVVWLECLLR